MPRAPAVRNGYYEARAGIGPDVEIDAWAIAAHQVASDLFGGRFHYGL
jgi:hypothetical protein